MSFEDDAKKAAGLGIPGAAMPEARQAELDALPAEDLAALWRQRQLAGISDKVDEVWDDIVYFDRLPREDPERAYAMALAILVQEAGSADKSVLLELAGKPFTTLVYQSGARLIDRMELEAPTNAGLRWLLGATYRWAKGEALKARFKALADEAAWRADKDAHDANEAPIDFAALTIAELARIWADQHGRPYKDRTENWDALYEFEQELNAKAPDKVIDLILEILTFEEDPGLLGYLAAGLLENVIRHETIDRVEREAAANDKFRWLLGGVWYWNDPEDIQARLDAIVQGQHWAN